jgi:hypothetical protein
VKPARLIKKLGAAIAVGLIALGIVAGTAAAANAGGSGELQSAISVEAVSGGGSGELQTAGSGELQ